MREKGAYHAGRIGDAVDVNAVGKVLRAGPLPDRIRFVTLAALSLMLSAYRVPKPIALSAYESWGYVHMSGSTSTRGTRRPYLV